MKNSRKTPPIILFSGPIRSGKTATLINLILESPQSFSGFLSPDVEGKRMLYDIASEELFPFETDLEDLENNVVIGRFQFLRKAFQLGAGILKMVSGKAKFCVIDEVGKLEITHDAGFEPSVGIIITDFLKNHFPASQLILIVRDSLLEDFMAKFNLPSDSFLTFHDNKSLAEYLRKSFPNNPS